MRTRLQMIGLVLLVCIPSALAVTPVKKEPAPEKVKIGFEIEIPYVINDGKDGLGGLAVDLWSQVASRLKWDYETVPLKPGEGVNALQEGRVQIVFLANPINARDESRVDYSTPFYTDREGVAMKQKAVTPSLWSTVKLIFSEHFLDIFLYLIIIFAVAGVMIWTVERKKNSGQFQRSAIKGIGDGIWWAVVTITTIGYGDKVARTHLGRAISTFWIIFGLLLTSIVTAAFASTVTLNSVKFNIQRVNDLRGIKTGVTSGTQSERTLKKSRVAYTTYDSMESGLTALNNGDVDAYFGSLAALDYEVKKSDYDDVILSFLGDNHRRYAFAVKEKNSFLEEVNVAIIEVLDGESWQDIEMKYGL